MRPQRLLAALLAAVMLAPALPALAQRRGRQSRQTRPAAAAAPRTAGSLPQLDLKVTEFTLPNGLRVVMHEDHSTPIVAVNLWYHVGSKNEVPGRTGFAHLFEHMMFQGSKNFDYDYFFPLQEAGGAINGSTNADRTNYFEVVPSNFLETALFLEADRLGGLLEAMTEEKLANQRDVVKNEKRQRYDNVPYGLVGAKISEVMYPRDHPYHWLTIGSLEDLTAASMDDVKDFFRRFYVPNNASLVIAGDFQPAEARRLVEKHFGPIKAGPDVRPVTARQPALERELRMQEEDRVALPRVYMAWHTVPLFSPDDAALDMLSAVLSSGKGSRIYRRLVYEQQVAQEAFAFHNSRELAGMFQVAATAKPDKPIADIEKMLDEEIAKIKQAPPTREEMERAYNEVEASAIYGIQTVLGKADQLNSYNTYRNRPVYFNQDLARYRQVTAADVRRVAQKYLTDKRLVMTVVPRGTQNKAGEPVATTPKTDAAAPATQQAAAGTTAPRTTPATTGERPAGTQPQTKTEAAQTRPAGSTPPAATAPAVPAQKKEQRRPDTSRLPKPGPEPSLTLPAIERRTLSNGLEVLVVRHAELPVVNMNLVVKTGGAADPADRAGLASMTASMIDEGTTRRSALDISNELASIGASLNTGAGWDSSSASLLSLKRHLDRALDIFADVVISPSFPENEMRRLRDQRLTSLKQRRDDATAIASVVYPTIIYGRAHPYGHSLIGDETSVAGYTAGDVRKFYDTYYRPNNAALVVVGDVTAAEIVPKLERAFGRWERGHVPAVDVTAAPQERTRNVIYLVDRPGAAQSVLNIGHIGVPRSNPDFFPLLVMNQLLGGQFISRVNLNLRENKGYTYGARTAFDYRRGAGPFMASAGVQTAVTKESVAEFIKELRGVRGEMPVTPEELAYAKQSLTRGFPRTFETPANIATRLEDIVIYELPDDYFNNYVARVNAVTLEDLTRVANRYVNPTRLAILVVGDRKVIEKGLRELEDISNEIVVVDSEGRPAPQGGPASGGGGQQ
ncbi:MAG TPA: pitrilysin family protein [Pyrinomonadaceae bacterium]|nr:pitrilysin family protein [Pyrinomonadaceae bacterium]